MSPALDFFKAKGDLQPVFGETIVTVRDCDDNLHLQSKKRKRDDDPGPGDSKKQRLSPSLWTITTNWARECYEACARLFSIQ